MRLKYAALLSPLVLSAVACASTGDEQSTAFPDPRPDPLPQIIQVPVPVPVQSEQRVLDDTKPARRKNQRTGKSHVVNATTVFPYEEDKVFPIAVSPGWSTTILLDPGEKYISAAVGDTSSEEKDSRARNWMVSATMAGSSQGPRSVVIVRAAEAGLKTNVFIATDRRWYQLDVTSYAKRAMDIVKWTYPNSIPSQVVPVQMGLQQAALSKQETPDSGGCNPLRLNMNYKIDVRSGSKPDWTPVRAYDCGGQKTYIAFPDNLGRMAAAVPLFVINDNSDLALPAQYRPVGNIYEVATQFKVAELRQGGTIVRISRAAG